MLRFGLIRNRGRRPPELSLSLTLGWVEAGFLAIMLVALVLRLWDLGARTMHYDEAIHLQEAWRLAQGHGYEHSPWMHGPFQIELTALILFVVGDTDSTARLGYALFGVILVGLPYFLRSHLGNAGALITGVMLALSPSMLYFSRFGRNDILMAVWAAALLILMWRYIHEGRNRYLFLASAVLALMFATKETAYLVTVVLGGLALLLALPQIVPWLRGRDSLARAAGPAGFFLLLATITLPQWSAMSSIFQDALGLTLASRDADSTGLVGVPQWEGPFLALPVLHFQWWGHLAAILAAVIGSSLLFPLNRPSARDLPALALIIASSIAAAGLVMLRPIGELTGSSVGTAADLIFSIVLMLGAIRATRQFSIAWPSRALLPVIPAIATAGYLALFTTVIDLPAVIQWLAPVSGTADINRNGIPLNFLIAGGVILLALGVSIYLGVLWLGKTWLALAGVFYAIWVTLYTTFFTNFAGIFTGMWQGMGYWIAQQDVARGNQPWYYYFVGISVYEALPAAFGIAGAVFFLRRGEILGVALSLWALATILAYTIASEKMPWLLVGVSLPLIFLSGMYLGRLAERVRWREAISRGYWSLGVLAPGLLAAGVYLLWRFVESDSGLDVGGWTLLAIIAIGAILSAYLVRLAPRGRGAALAGLGLGALLLGFGVWGAFRAAYTYDDSNVEILAYAQGGADLQQSFLELNRHVFQRDLDLPALVDYEAWYPFQWYVRHAQEEGKLSFRCFKTEDEDGYVASCETVSDSSKASAWLIDKKRGERDQEYLEDFRREGPFRNLIWFPESYRRPGEDRPSEGSFLGLKGIPNREQFTKDLRFFKSVAGSRDSWREGLDYWIFRRLEDTWYDSLYYTYLPQPGA